MRASYVEFWKNNVINNGRLDFYNKCKNSFKFEDYLNKLQFNKRKLVIKLRCSDHELEIEKGRHKKIPREMRLCKSCTMGKIETEDHFLTECNLYDDIREITIGNNNLDNLFEVDTVELLGKFILLALDKRRDKEV